MWYTTINRFEDQCDPESAAHIQSKAVGVFTQGDHVPGISRHDLLTSPVKLSNAPAVPRARAPKFGEHTRAVLAELGYSPAEVGELFERGVAAESKGKYVRKPKKS